jgi:hypothetical protein
MILTRRHFLAGSGALVVACQKREPETTLAHLYGKEWVHGAYSHYAQAYATVEKNAEARSFDSYKLFAQRGITALDGLQSREVPFYIRVAPDAGSFRVERDVPERLTFSASMSEADRAEATRTWKLARESLHTDYDEVHRLDWALTGLLTELSRVRNAIDQGLIEEFRICRQLTRLDAGGELPFRLPFQVTRADYQDVVRLVLERLENDRDRLKRTEAAMIAVGLAARSTDAESSSLAANMRKVLLAVVKDAEDAKKGRALSYPAANREELLERARGLQTRIVASSEYKQWLAVEQEKEDVLGQLLTVLDSLTGLPTSSVYRSVMRVWRGGGDYLAYLNIAIAIVPSSTGLSGVLGDARDKTVRCRELLSKSDRARSLVNDVQNPDGDHATELEGAVVNVGTRRARKQLDRQLMFFESNDELERVKTELAESPLGTGALPAIPR